MANDVILTCRLNKASLPVMNTQQLAYVLIEAVPGAGEFAGHGAATAGDHLVAFFALLAVHFSSPNSLITVFKSLSPRPDKFTRTI